MAVAVLAATRQQTVEPMQPTFPEGVGADSAPEDGPDEQPSARARATARSQIPRASWGSLDSIDLPLEFARQVPVLRSVPRFLQPAFRQALTFALQQILRADSEGAWKLLLLAPRLLLARGAAQGEVGRDVLTKRVADFLAARWMPLLEGARGLAVEAGARPVRRAGAEGRCEQACALVRRGELSGQATPGNVGRRGGMPQDLPRRGLRARRCPSSCFVRAGGA